MSLPAHLRPNLEVARRFLAARRPPAARVLVCAITGAHHYGFPSPDSDLDIKGIHLAPTNELLGLSSPPDTVDVTALCDGIECDLTLNEARPALKLLLQGNGNVLERITSPYQLVDTPAVGELQALARAALSRRFFAHYRGFGRGMRREHERILAETGAARVKPLLYIYRVALTGAHLLLTGEVVADLTETAPRYGFDGALELVAKKRAGVEHEPLSAPEDAHHRLAWPRLDALLDEARVSSPLPEEPPNGDVVDAWLVAQRLAAVR